MAQPSKRWIGRCMCAAALAALPGCAAVAIAAGGVGMATGVSHTLSGIVYKTFAAPEVKVRRSTVAALGRMQIKILDTTRDGNKELINARAADRNIEIQIQALTPNPTPPTATASKQRT